MSYHCAKESDDSDPVSMGWTLVAGADIEEKVSMLGGRFVQNSRCRCFCDKLHFHTER
jgi:hypothetical protein